jgi:hypothetical protein
VSAAELCPEIDSTWQNMNSEMSTRYTGASERNIITDEWEVDHWKSEVSTFIVEFCF